MLDLLYEHVTIHDFSVAGARNFISISSQVLGGVTRIFQALVSLLLMSETLLGTYEPFGDAYIKTEDGFLALFRVKLHLLIPLMFLITSSIESNGLETLLANRLSNLYSQGVSAVQSNEQGRMLQGSDECSFGPEFISPEEFTESFDSDVFAKPLSLARLIHFVVGVIGFAVGAMQSCMQQSCGNNDNDDDGEEERRQH